LTTVGNTFEPALAGVIGPPIEVPMLVALSSLQPRSALHTLLLARTVERGSAA
jgi:ACR3 family arsenite efflux pump ArsB